jgi:hypothetical protein
MNALTPAQIGYRHFVANPFHDDAILSSAGNFLRLACLARRINRCVVPLGAREACFGQAYLSLLTCIRFLCFVLFLRLPFKCPFHDSPFFLRIPSAGWSTQKLKICSLLIPSAHSR